MCVVTFECVLYKTDVSDGGIGMVEVGCVYVDIGFKRRQDLCNYLYKVTISIVTLLSIWAL